MRIRERYELAEELRSRYRGSGWVERGQLLDSFCLATGYGRKYAIKVLKGRRRRSVRKRVPRTKRYVPGFRSALKMCWEASDYLRSQRLQPFLPDLAQILVRHDQLTCSAETIELLASASVATVERKLHEFRRVLVGRRMSQTKPGGLLRREIPVVVGRWRDLDTPGYLETHLFSYSGEVAAGDWIRISWDTNLSGDWIDRMAITGKGQTRMVAALKRIQHHLPLPLLERPSNNGSEFISWHQSRRLCFHRAVHVKRHVSVVGVLSSCTDVPPSVLLLERA